MSDKPIRWYSLMATCYPLGQMPKAPGTWGSLPGLLVGYGIYAASGALAHDSWISSAVLLCLLAIFSWWIIHQTEALWQSHDDKSIVIDEVAGQAIPIAFFEPSLIFYLGAFLLFRFFDISKPLFIGWADRKLPGALGTLLDDIFAGLVVLAICLIDKYWSHILLS